MNMKMIFLGSSLLVVSLSLLVCANLTSTNQYPLSIEPYQYFPLLASGIVHSITKWIIVLMVWAAFYSAVIFGIACLSKGLTDSRRPTPTFAPR